MIWFWALWLAGIAATFALGETYALRYGGTTLSRWMANVQKAFPIWGFLWGALIGGLAVHFWWGGMAVCF